MFFLLSLLSLHGMAQVERQHSPKYSASTLTKLLERQAQTRGGTEENVLHAYVRLAPHADADFLRDEYNVHLNTAYEDIYTAVIPMRAVPDFVRHPDVLEVDAGNEIRFMMDSVKTLTHVNEVQSGEALPRSYQGEGVLIGIIDNGFDFLHPNFRDEEGNSRIRCVWDQNQIPAVSNSSFGYGWVYRTGEEIRNVMHDLSRDTHGTHVAGIAAGSANNRYRGIAPKADIVLVSVNKTEPGMLDAIDFLIRYADEVNKPLSVNLSMGSLLGYKDGSDNFTLMIDKLMENRKGRLLSIAAGNEGHRNSTLFKEFTAQGTGEVKSLLNPPSYGRENLFVHGLSGQVYTVNVSLRDTVKNELLFSQQFVSGETWSKSFEQFGSDKAGALFNVSSAVNTRTANHSIRISFIYNKPTSEVWEIAVSAPGRGKCVVCCDYGYFTAAGKTGYTDGTNDYTIAATATGHSPLAVGAYVSRQAYTDIAGTPHQAGWTRFGLYPLSGKGPTYDGRIKPDVVAPGATVISSFNSYAASYSVPRSEKVLEETDNSLGRKYAWGIANGTSMATPVVTGVLALWLEANPALTMDEVREIIRETAVADSHTGGLPNARYGMGKLDALGGLRKLLQQTAITDETFAGRFYAYERETGILTLLTDEVVRRIDVYTVSGEWLHCVEATGGRSFFLGNFESGLYLLRFRTSSGQYVFKQLL